MGYSPWGCKNWAQLKRLSTQSYDSAILLLGTDLKKWKQDPKEMSEHMIISALHTVAEEGHPSVPQQTSG